MARSGNIAGPARIEQLRIRNYRALREVEVRFTPLTILIGPNGSGKSTLFDVFNFLSECFRLGLRHAWDRRGKAKELRTRGSQGPIEFELKYRETPTSPLITYRLAIDEDLRGPFVAEEWLQWRRGAHGKPFRFLDYRSGQGEAVSGEDPDENARRVSIPLQSRELIAVNALGQFAEHPRVAALRSFISDWYVSYLSVDETRSQPEAGPQERLSKTGDNLANVLQFLAESHPDRLEKIFAVLRERVPRIEKVLAETMPDGRLLLQIKDAPFDQPVLARFASDGTLKMLAYLVVLYDPDPPQFIGIEEPENFLHPPLLPKLAEECRMATQRSQLLVTTHSPHFIDGARLEEVRILVRDQGGHTRISEPDSKLKALVDEGASLGYLWLSGHFNVDWPLLESGAR
ncbi:MAG: ATPase [Bryobacteraceae bacterium]|nr:MAG: ATPase [Bryobacteraceae bacterium]